LQQGMANLDCGNCAAESRLTSKCHVPAIFPLCAGCADAILKGDSTLYS
jgi:hypothetical protein